MYGVYPPFLLFNIQLDLWILFAPNDSYYEPFVIQLSFSFLDLLCLVCCVRVVYTHMIYHRRFNLETTEKGEKKDHTPFT